MEQINGADIGPKFPNGLEFSQVRNRKLEISKAPTKAKSQEPA